MHSAQYIDIDGRRCFVETFGDVGTPVLCIHTAGQSGVQYRYVAPALANLGFQAVVVDLPGHGRSEPARDGPIADLGWYADWCLHVLELLEIDHPWLLGCSIGGTIVMDMAIKSRQPLAGIVAMAASDPSVMGGVKPRRYEVEDSGSPSIRDRTYFGALESCGQLVPGDRVEMIALMHCREDWHVTFADGTGMNRHALWDRLPSIDCPAIIVAGKDDMFIPYDGIRQVAERIPGANFRLIDGVGHYPMEELADFADRFSSWTREAVGGSG